MEVGKWVSPKNDDEILMMLFNGMIKDFKCPHCDKQTECCPSVEKIECECGEEYYSPIYDPELGL